MTYITKVPHLHDCGIFRDFIWPPDLPKFGQYNLIYGWNGTGKTTLSRIFRNLEQREQPKMGEVTLRIEDNDINGEKFPQSNLQIRVFNRNFIRKNVFPVGGGEIPPIFVLGAQSVEKQKEIEELQKELVDAELKHNSANSDKDRASKEIDQLCIDRARTIKDILRSSDQNSYNNYNKSNFRDEATGMLKSSDSATHRLTEIDRGRLLSQYRATLKNEVTELAYEIPNLELITGRVSELLQTTVVSEAIDALKDDPEFASWIRQGLALHRDQNTEKCRFCEQSLPEQRLATLQAHFNDQYDQFIKSIDWEIGALKTKRVQLQGFESNLPDEARLYDNCRDEFRAAKEQLVDVLTRLNGFLYAMVQALENKKNKVFESTNLGIEAPLLQGDAVANLNTVIQKHNQASDNFETQRQEARKRLADDMIAESLEKFTKLENVVDTAKRTERATKEEVDRLNTEISRLELEITEHRRPAEELNEDIKKYLGHDELRVEIEETGYSITRGKHRPLLLSEGEITTIALLYFLKSLRDRDFTLKKGIVVLDDPVSSLDANALFLAFGFIQERTKDAGQLFVLTHNFSFFRQVRNWFHRMKRQNKTDEEKRPARFFMLEPSQKDNVRVSAIRRLDPLLEKYDSEYHYLFDQVYQASNQSVPQNLEENYVLPNIARRMLEAFLAFRFPHLSGDLWKQMEKVVFDEAKKIRIIRFLHTHSHSATIGEPEHDLTALAEGSNVLNDLLEMIKSQDEAHYLAMVQLCESKTNSGTTRDQGKST